MKTKSGRFLVVPPQDQNQEDCVDQGLPDFVYRPSGLYNKLIPYNIFRCNFFMFSNDTNFCCILT